MKYGKVWGTTTDICSGPNFSLKLINGIAGYKCSKHKHEHKINFFHVISGCLIIRVWKNNYNLVDETILGKGESTIVKPGEYHEFEVLESTLATELYWVEMNEEDIVRKDVGGKTHDKV